MGQISELAQRMETLTEMLEKNENDQQKLEAIRAELQEIKKELLKLLSPKQNGK
ncbi:MAG: hypothetical protein NTX00_02670 [Candidatus Parcubacteria bacterium]|nr:hypothetical protein [Candidatus Parcubacteria bacterium]